MGHPSIQNKNLCHRTFIIVHITKKMSTEYYILIETNICLGSSECIYSILDARSNLVTAESCREIVMKDVPASSFCAKCMLECLCASEIFEAEGL